MTLLSKSKRFFIVSVNRESCRGFLDRTRGLYFLYSLDHLLRVQTLQILNPQSIERVWSLLQLLHSKTTKSCPHFSKRLAKWGLNSCSKPAISCSLLSTLLSTQITKFVNILAYLYQFVNGGESCFSDVEGRMGLSSFPTLSTGLYIKFGESHHRGIKELFISNSLQEFIFKT
jgi:hypothetical protein